jgi:hypothetical protein
MQPADSIRRSYWKSYNPSALSIFLRNIAKRLTVIAFDNTFDKALYRYGVNAMKVLNDKERLNSKLSLTREYNFALLEKGVDAVFCKLIEFKADTLHYYYLSEFSYLPSIRM